MFLHSFSVVRSAVRLAVVGPILNALVYQFRLLLMSQSDAQIPFSSDSRDEIAIAKNGCQATQGKLLDDFRSYLRHVAVNGIDSDVRGKLSASDLVQETMLDAHRNFHNFQGEGSVQLKAWLRRILINNLLNHYRRLRGTKKRQVSREKSDAVDELVTSEEETPSALAILREEELQLEQALAALPPIQRQIILMRHREQLSFREVGERLGKTPDAARMMWYRAFDELSRALEKRIP